MYFFFWLFFAEFELLIFHNNIVKISEKQVELENLTHYLPFRLMFNLHYFYYEKKCKYFI